MNLSKINHALARWSWKLPLKVPSLSSPSSHNSPTQQKSSPVKPYISSFAPYLIYYQKLASLLLTPRTPPGVIILLACKVAGRTCRWHVCWWHCASLPRHYLFGWAGCRRTSFVAWRVGSWSTGLLCTQLIPSFGGWCLLLLFCKGSWIGTWFLLQEGMAMLVVSV